MKSLASEILISRTVVSVTAIAVAALLSAKAIANSSAKNASIDIFLQPSHAIVQHVKTQSRALEQLGETTFYKQGYLPHVTLYLTSYPLSALPEIKRIVKEIAKNQHAFPLEVSGVSVTKSDWVFLTMKDNNDLQSLSDRIARRLSSLHDKNMPEPAWVKLYPEKEAFIKKYGSPNVFSQFQPHITLLANGDKQAVSRYQHAYQEKTKGQKNVYGHGIGIGIGYANEYGQMTKMIARYPFPSKSAIRKKG